MMSDVAYIIIPVVSSSGLTPIRQLNGYLRVNHGSFNNNALLHLRDIKTLKQSHTHVTTMECTNKFANSPFHPPSFKTGANQICGHNCSTDIRIHSRFTIRCLGRRNYQPSDPRKHTRPVQPPCSTRSRHLKSAVAVGHSQG
jgi:hypothetical protein